MNGSDRPVGVTIITTCPRCGESVEIVVSKQEIKAIYKGFKHGIRTAQIVSEKEVERIRRGDEKWRKQAKA